ncbi:MAG: BamA/TamA family outer membrane protein [Planctomycetota bacterium]
MKRGFAWAALACSLLALAACRSRPIEPSAPAPELPTEAPVAADLDVRLRFVGTSDVDEDELRRRAERVFVGVSDPAWLDSAAEDAAYLAQLELVDAGYLDAKVIPTVERRGEKPPLVTLTLQPGPRTAWTRTVVRGNERVSNEIVMEFFDARRTLVDKALGSTRWFSESALEDAISDLERYYHADGFRDAQVTLERVELKEGRAVPHIIVSEGVRRVVRAVQVQGLPEEADVPIERLIASIQGSASTPRRSIRFARMLEGALAKRGWADATATVREEITEEGAVTLHVVMEPGERVRVAEIRIEGLERTREGFVRRLMRLEEGEWYDATEVRESFRLLLGSGVFDEVDLQLEGDGTERTLVASVVESPAIELFVEPGLGSYEGPRLTIGARHRNIFGTGRIVRAEALVSDKSLGAELGFTDPWWLGDRTVTDVTLSAVRREEPSFEFDRLGFQTTIRTNYTRHFSLAWTYAYTRSDVFDFNADDPLVADLLGDIDVSSIRLAPRYDRRDNVLVPRRGYRSEFSTEWADSVLGSEIDFVRLVASHSHYEALTEGTVIAANVRTGWIRPTEGESIPLQERFFNGGQNSVRAFRESELGPTDVDGDPVGGEVFHLVSIELRQELLRNFGAGLFFDTGAVNSDHGDWASFQDFRYGVGVGLRYMLPIGPLRLDLGYNPEASADEDDWVLHFALGMPF